MRKILLCCLTVFIVLSCKNEKKIELASTPDELKLSAGKTLEIWELVKANNKFSFDLFRKMADDGNLFISPYSVSSAFALLYAGSGTDAEKEIGNTFNWPENSISFHKAMSSFHQKQMKNEKEFSIHLANRIYADTSINFYNEFAEINKSNYKSEIEPINFKNKKESAKNINKWVSEKTQKMIPELLKEDNLEGVNMLLANAVYFYGAWANPFEESNTETDTFFVARDQNSKTFFMSSILESKNTEFNVSFFEDSVFQVLQLPYHKNLGSMIIMLPKVDNKGNLPDLTELFTKLSYEDFEKLIFTNSTPANIHVSIPKWSHRSAPVLSDVLKGMGMKKSFEEGADFKKIASNDNKPITNIIHQAIIEVSEKGTKAAAATAITKGETSAAPEEPVYFTANHPFVYLIRDNTTGAILFIGQYLKP